MVGYNYSFTLYAGSVSPSAPGSDINEYHSVGAKYIVAPGLFVFGEYVHFDVQDEGIRVNGGDVGLLGIGVRF